MGTRAKAYVHQTDLESEKIVCIYTQFDGYPEGFLADIIKCLNKGKSIIVNGINSHKSSPQYFNGMGCMAAYLVSKLKKQIGYIYLFPPNGDEENYTYHLFIKEWPKMSSNDYQGEEIYLKVISFDRSWEGKLSEFPKDWDNEDKD